MKYIASCSFDKDSLAMVLRLIEEHKPLDEILFYDTGMEFECIYNNLEKLKKITNIPITILKPNYDFQYAMFDKPINVGKPNEHKGYSWCGGRCRWGTTHKLQAIEKYTNGCCEYVGIASDELQRIAKERKPTKIMPLVEWGMTEKDCLEYCYQRGWNWNEDGIELYSILDRVSCWCCANKNLKELKAYYKYLPTYWNKLKELQSKTNRPFKKNKSIFDLEKQFEESEKR